MGSATIAAGETATKPSVTLLAGDIDGNNVIDQFDAMTIGMSYNTADPAAADLNNDGTINVLDLEILAANYCLAGPINWDIRLCKRARMFLHTKPTRLKISLG